MNKEIIPSTCPLIWPQDADLGKENADSLSKEERRVHHYIVKKMAVVKDPITAELITDELEMPIDQVHEIINKLENLKTFIFRSDGKGINWAYPLSLENTGFKMTASSGEKFYAAWAADAFATPFVYGRLHKKKCLLLFRQNVPIAVDR